MLDPGPHQINADQGARGQGGWRWARWGEQLSYVRGCHTYFLLSYFAGFTFFQIVLPEEIYIISEGSIPLKSELFLLFVLGAPPPSPPDLSQAKSPLQPPSPPFSK